MASGEIDTGMPGQLECAYAMVNSEKPEVAVRSLTFGQGFAGGFKSTRKRKKQQDGSADLSAETDTDAGPAPFFTVADVPLALPPCMFHPSSSLS